MEVHTSTASAISIISSAISGNQGRSANPATSGQEDSRQDTVKDQVSISPEARAYSRGSNSEDGNGPSTSTASGTVDLTQDELRQLMELKSRDREVRTHEQMHLSAAGRYAAGGPSFTYQQGPDGQRYAIGGEVPIDVSKERTPEETIVKMETVQRAALAPAEPSAADRQIAAQAAMTAAQARQELLLQRQEEPPPLQASEDSSETEKDTDSSGNNDENPAVKDTAAISSMITAYASMQAQGRSAQFNAAS